MIRSCISLLVCLFLTTASLSQGKAIIIQNFWNNDLNNYNPKEFFDRLAVVFKKRLAVKELTSDPASFKTVKIEEGWDRKVKEQVEAKKLRPDSSYFIAISSELRLPAFNLGKFLFKNPPRSSKLTFTFHIYNGAGTEIMADTIINRGCIIKRVDEGKGSSFFYSDHTSFLDDMQCHLSVIERILQEKQFAEKPKGHKEI
jgi:hypothetical protein